MNERRTYTVKQYLSRAAAQCVLAQYELAAAEWWDASKIIQIRPFAYKVSDRAHSFVCRHRINPAPYDAEACRQSASPAPIEMEV